MGTSSKNAVRSRCIPAATVIAAATLLSACGGGSSGSTSPAPASSMGTVGVSLTDAPACGFDAVNVTVAKVRIHQSATASDTDTGWTDITLSPARKINLLNLTNGALDALGQTSLVAGHYSQLRLVLDANSSQSLSNSVVPTGGVETTLATPSAVQSGIKLVNEFDVAAGQRVDLVLDFDACKSIVTTGNGKYLLKPIVKVIPTAINGISGYIATSLLNSHVVVNAQQNGNVISSTVPSAAGDFFIARLAPGSYDVVVTADDHAAAVVGAVPVASTTSNIALSTAAAPLSLPASLSASISGAITLTPSSTTEDGVIAAKQSFAAGPLVTIKYRNADLVTGAYILEKLPTTAPQYAPYTNTLPLIFSQSAAVTPGAGKYRLDASATGYSVKSVASVDVTLGSQTGTNFSLTP